MHPLFDAQNIIQEAHPPPLPHTHPCVPSKMQTKPRAMSIICILFEGVQWHSRLNYYCTHQWPSWGTAEAPLQFSQLWRSAVNTGHICGPLQWVCTRLHATVGIKCRFDWLLFWNSNSYSLNIYWKSTCIITKCIGTVPENRVGITPLSSTSKWLMMCVRLE